MSRRQRIVLVAGGMLLLAAIMCPPWSYYGGEQKMCFPPGMGPPKAHEKDPQKRPKGSFSPKKQRSQHQKQP